MQWMGIVITRLTGEGVRPGPALCRNRGRLFECFVVRSRRMETQPDRGPKP